MILCDLCGMVELSELLKRGIANSKSYKEYLSEIERYAAEGKTSGVEQRQNLIEFTKLNAFRMQRLEKTTTLNSNLVQHLSTIEYNIYWLVLTETWCGDAAQNLPTLHSMSEASDHIDLRLIYRDEHHELMSHFLTEGGQSVPKLVAVDGDMNVLYVWGPRPKPAQEMIQSFKNGNSSYPSYADVSLDIQKWYAKDNTQTLQSEIGQLISQYGAEEAGSIALKQ